MTRHEAPSFTARAMDSWMKSAVAGLIVASTVMTWTVDVAWRFGERETRSARNVNGRRIMDAAFFMGIPFWSRNCAGILRVQRTFYDRQSSIYNEKRRGWDSNPRYRCRYTTFPGWPVQPLLHLSQVLATVLVCIEEPVASTTIGLRRSSRMFLVSAPPINPKTLPCERCSRGFHLW